MYVRRIKHEFAADVLAGEKSWTPGMKTAEVTPRRVLAGRIGPGKSNKQQFAIEPDSIGSMYNAVMHGSCAWTHEPEPK